MNVIFDKIYIFDVAKEKAYSTEFKKGVNIITSSDIDGTDRGKSVLLLNANLFTNNLFKLIKIN